MITRYGMLIISTFEATSCYDVWLFNGQKGKCLFDMFSLFNKTAIFY